MLWGSDNNLSPKLYSACHIIVKIISIMGWRFPGAIDERLVKVKEVASSRLSEIRRLRSGTPPATWAKLAAQGTELLKHTLALIGQVRPLRRPRLDQVAWAWFQGSAQAALPMDKERLIFYNKAF
jgi:hypothetical protein